MQRDLILPDGGWKNVHSKSAAPLMSNEQLEQLNVIAFSECRESKLGDAPARN